jgi:zinc/manganese transport system substrate-binding protein/manganese/iron transport system substrate-binding protein
MWISSRLLRRDISGPVAIAIVAGIVAACSSGGGTARPGSSPEPDALRVVATTTVFADLVRQVGGARVNVDSLVPAGGEPHTFDPTPADIARVADADVVFMNGLGLDEWLGGVAEDSGTSAPIVELGEDLDGVEYIAGEAHADDEGHESEGDAHAGETVNPHLWLNVAYASKYAERIGEQLAAIDPDHAGDYEAGTTAYIARLTELDTWARGQISGLPDERRRIVSFHEALPYFAQAYGLEIVGAVVDAPGQDPSAGEIADLVDAIRATGASALFGEAQFNPELARTVAAEAGIPVVTDLYTDSLGDPPVDTYEGLIRSDVDKVVEALQP